MNEPQNSSNRQRRLLPFEPDFSTMSDPSIVIDPPTNTWESNRQTSLNRQSRKGQPKSRHKSKKRRRHSASSSSSSSTSSSLSSHKKSKKPKRSRHSHKKRRRHPSLSSSSQPMKDYGRYQRQRHPSPLVVDAQSIEQPVRIIEETPNIHSDNVVQQFLKDSGSEPKIETWSFDKAINEVFRLLPEELCPKPSEDHTPFKPLAGIEQLMESRSSPFLVLPQSKLIENTTKFIQDKLNSEKLGQDWLCLQQLVKLLAPMRYYEGKSQYFPIENIPHLDADASQIDMSSRGKYSVPFKNFGIWEKRAHNLSGINYHADLFSTAAYLCLQQESMSVNALSRLLEAVAK